MPAAPPGKVGVRTVYPPTPSHPNSFFFLKGPEGGSVPWGGAGTVGGGRSPPGGDLDQSGFVDDASAAGSLLHDSDDPGLVSLPPAGGFQLRAESGRLLPRQADQQPPCGGGGGHTGQGTPPTKKYSTNQPPPVKRKKAGCALRGGLGKRGGFTPLRGCPCFCFFWGGAHLDLHQVVLRELGDPPLYPKLGDTEGSLPPHKMGPPLHPPRGGVTPPQTPN